MGGTIASRIWPRLFALVLLTGCATSKHHVVISTSEQKMVLLEEGHPIAVYPVSTSKFGLGDTVGSNQTPMGKFKVRHKIGHDAPAGAVFKSRRWTGEVLPIDAPGRDPIVTRILWLDGLEPQNRNAYRRYIYIHGTPEERNIGQPVSYGCIRMRSQDVMDLFNRIRPGTRVDIVMAPVTPVYFPQDPAPLNPRPSEL